MLIQEANERLQTPISNDQLQAIHILYCLLDLSKDDFCKMVDAVGIDVLTERENTYNRLHEASLFLNKKERYDKNKKELCTIDAQIERLELQRSDIVQEVLCFEDYAKNIFWLELKSSEHCLM